MFGRCARSDRKEKIKFPRTDPVRRNPVGEPGEVPGRIPGCILPYFHVSLCGERTVPETTRAESCKCFHNVLWLSCEPPRYARTPFVDQSRDLSRYPFDDRVYSSFIFSLAPSLFLSFSCTIVFSPSDTFRTITRLMQLVDLGRCRAIAISNDKGTKRQISIARNRLQSVSQNVNVPFAIIFAQIVSIFKRNLFVSGPIDGHISGYTTFCGGVGKVTSVLILSQLGVSCYLVPGVPISTLVAFSTACTLDSAYFSD